MAYKANIYTESKQNPTIAHSDAARSNLGICFSGGGSRAMTCAWGQLLGLKTLKLMDRVRYISSVSGGTWASSIYAFLPDHITDDDLLGAYYTPECLSLATDTGKLNVDSLNKYSLGQAPAGMGVQKLGAWAACFLIVHSSSNYKWFWADIVAHFILEPYGLRSEGKKSWISSKSFSLSREYANRYFPPDAPAPSIENYFFLRSGRPFIIMNNNMMEKTQITNKAKSNIVQLPNQVTPVSGGALGQTPNATIIGGGSVESYGYSSTLDQTTANSSPVKISISQPYSLIDIVSTSSAFFADAIMSWIAKQVGDPNKKKKLVNQIKACLKPEHEKLLIAKVEKDFLDIFEIGKDIEGIIGKYLEKIVQKDLSFLGECIPTYNYWPIKHESSNREIGYTDGGTLDNTGVIGLLAQTDDGSSHREPMNIVVFDNTDTPLENKNGHIIAASQAAPLFGIDFDTRSGAYKPFTRRQKDPNNKEFNAASLITVFDNQPDSSGNTPFDKLNKGLYAASCGAASGETPNNSKANREPAFYQFEAMTVNNSLAHITAGRTVNMMYIQNAKMLRWQNRIGDATLKHYIAQGQEKSNDPFIAFSNFPYYNTFSKIGLEPKESNTLSQMWAWALADDSSPLKKQLKTFIENASS